MWSERKAGGSSGSSSSGSSSGHKAVPTQRRQQQEPPSSSSDATDSPAPPISSSHSSFGAYKAVSRAFGVKLPSATSPLSFDDGAGPTGGKKPVFVVGSPAEDAEGAAQLEAFLAMIGRTETACCQVAWRRGQVEVRANERFAGLFIAAAEGERVLRKGRTRPEYLWGRSVFWVVFVDCVVGLA